jgi:methylmalonyl-CoA/ethylmalonyl-CoA epimerase
MRKIEHIGIAVSNLNETSKIYEKLFGAPAYKEEEVASEGVKTAFFFVVQIKLNFLKQQIPKALLQSLLQKKEKEFTTLLLM